MRIRNGLNLFVAVLPLLASAALISCGPPASTQAETPAVTPISVEIAQPKLPTLEAGPMLNPDLLKVQANPKVIKIVSSLPRTGSAKAQTDTIVNGIKMALEEADYKAGDFKIEYEDLDDATANDGKWTPERETANANKAINDPDVMIYIGPYNSGAASVSMPILNRGNLLMISPACTAIGLTKVSGEPNEPQKYRPSGGINFTRVVPADDIQGPVAADFARRELKKKTVFIIDDNEVYGKGVANAFKERAKDLKLTVVGKQESIDYKQANFRTLMAKIKNDFNPDVIYFGGTSQTGAGQIAKDMVNEGLGDKVLIVPDGCFEKAFIDAAGANIFKTLECYVTFGGLPPSELKGKGAEFVKKYMARYKVEPEGYAIYGYESANVGLLAIKNAGKKDRAAITKACLAIKDYDGAIGKWSFDANGDTTATTLSISRVVDGDFKFVKLLQLK
jgi:branched-chain amino acid transport system substrate-binding protein